MPVSSSRPAHVHSVHNTSSARSSSSSGSTPTHARNPYTFGAKRSTTVPSASGSRSLSRARTRGSSGRIPAAERSSTSATPTLSFPPPSPGAPLPAPAAAQPRSGRTVSFRGRRRDGPCGFHRRPCADRRLRWMAHHPGRPRPSARAAALDRPHRCRTGSFGRRSGSRAKGRSTRAPPSDSDPSVRRSSGFEIRPAARAIPRTAAHPPRERERRSRGRSSPLSPDAMREPALSPAPAWRWTCTPGSASSRTSAAAHAHADSAHPHPFTGRSPRARCR
jgi:hypothetical protein